ncbi:MAG TPA: vanadium-dependent haloperoxidase [Steroidobacteraceae bacterium]
MLAHNDHSDARLVAAWNGRVLAMAVNEDKLLTLKGVRTAAMMHIAMHDALNAIDPRYASYAFHTAAPEASPIAAAAQAAYEVAINQYPGEKPQLENELNASLAQVRVGRARAIGIEIGKASAVAILQKRADDGWNNEAVYRLQPMAPGVYAEFPEHSGTPQGFIFGAGWATVKPFALEAPDQFRSPPPPAITSDAYTRAFNEVKEVGRFESPARSADQTHLALWWKDFVENSHNRLARQLVRKEHTDLWVTARLFALLNMSVMDAYIGVFENKFHYNHWRPYTAIRWADNDENPATTADLAWNNTHRHTYAFPSYPSAHGTACAAAATMLADAFGDDYHFTMRTDTVDEAGPGSAKIQMDPPTRSFDSFSAAADECAMSRVYLGIHFRYDSIEGNRLGSEIGNYILRNSLKSASQRQHAQSADN